MDLLISSEEAGISNSKMTIPLFAYVCQPVRSFLMLCADSTSKATHLFAHIKPVKDRAQASFHPTRNGLQVTIPIFQHNPH